MRMGPRLRKLALAVHLATSVGWLGAVIAYLPLDVTASVSDDVPLVRAAYLGMDLLARWALVPLSWAALLTGLVVSLGTRWGLLRHYWVLLSFLLTLVAATVLLVETRVIGAYADVAADPTASDARILALGSTLPHSIGGLAVLLVVLALNVYKPPGLTPYGWRKQQEEEAPRASGRS